MYREDSLRTRGFHWEHEEFGTWQLKVPDGCTAATVWPNGAWHTWDCRGVGGENDVESDVTAAKDAALRAVALAMVLEGWHSGGQRPGRRGRR